jgi:acyl-CoA thioesterase FadM
VNNAAYLALLRDATDRVLPGAGELAEIDVEFRRPIPPDVDLDVDVAIRRSGDGGCVVGYEIFLDGASRATAVATWRTAVETAAPLPALDRDAGGRTFAWAHTVRSYELSPDGALRPSAALQWFEYAVYRAAERVGWTAERMRDADFVTLQIGHHLTIGPHPRVGERLEIVSRIVELRRVSGMWHHEARSGEAVIAADRSRGAFLDVAGKPRRAPEDMIAALLRGDAGMA